ncbi:MAG: chemotaxis protein CheW [Deltaproteobacteria bacterium]|nr:chemotaxis protein CheW [Deltaproteobacteria bacterium]
MQFQWKPSLRQGKVIGLEFLSHLLNISQNGHKMDHDEQMPVLIVQAANDCLGIVVDKLYRKEEIVIKPLADYLAGLPGIAGASILGDGKTILILEPNELVSMATRN